MRNDRNGVPRLIKIKRGAEETGIPYTTLRDAIRGEIPLVRVGRALYIERRDIDRWIDARKEARGLMATQATY